METKDLKQIYGPRIARTLPGNWVLPDLQRRQNVWRNYFWGKAAAHELQRDVLDGL
jgi:hypothetical protein